MITQSLSIYSISTASTTKSESQVSEIEKNNSDLESIRKNKEARDKTYEKITNNIEIKPIPGGPELGDGSKLKRGSELSNYIESTWPSENLILNFPNREYRVSFKDYVDSRTFQGFVKNKKTGEIAYGKYDGSPALFIRSEITKSKTLDVIGTLPSLKTGEYYFEFKVNKYSNDRKEIVGKVNFSVAEEINSTGGGNHRHGMSKFIFENELFDATRGIIAFLLALSFIKSKKILFVNSVALGSLALFYLISFIFRNINSILSTNEILSRLDTWGFVGVTVAFFTMILSKTIVERRVILSSTLVFSLLSEYSLVFVGGIITPIYMSLIVFLGSFYILQFLDKDKFSNKSMIFITSLLLVCYFSYYNVFLKFENKPTGISEHIEQTYIIVAVIIIISALKILSNYFKKFISKKFNIFINIIFIITSIFCISIISDSVVIL